MKKRILFGMALYIGSLGFVVQASAGHVQSLRGDMSVEEMATAPEIKQYAKDGEPIPRDYLQQPPLIPHKIDGYRINLKYNKCLTCHSWKNYKAKRATKISQTHFASRDGAILANVSARRYFCTQCHVPQANAKPLVENTFKPVEALKMD